MCYEYSAIDVESALQMWKIIYYVYQVYVLYKKHCDKSQRNTFEINYSNYRVLRKFETIGNSIFVCSGFLTRGKDEFLAHIVYVHFNFSKSAYYLLNEIIFYQLNFIFTTCSL